MNKNIKVVLTGANGFIGSHILEEYEKNDIQVLAIDKILNTSSKSTNTRIVVGDIGSEEVLEEIKNFKPNIINHHAAQVDVRFSLQDPTTDLIENTYNSLKLLNLCKEIGSDFIFASSAGAIDGKEIPNSPYGISKLTTEKYIEFYRRHFNISATIFRYPNVYGPRQTKGVVGIFIKKALMSEQIEINGGRQTRDFIYVKDIARLNVLATQLPKINLTVASERPISMISLIRMLEDKLKKKLTIKTNPLVVGEVLESNLRQSIQLASRLPLQFFTSFDQGIEETIQYWKQILGI